MARRLGSQALGIFSIGMSLVTLSVIISTMGLTGAASRFVASYNGLGEFTKIHTFIRASLIVIILLSIILGGLIILGRRWIAESIFHEKLISSYLPLFGLMVPVSALSLFLMQVLTGYKKVASRTIINNFIRIPLKILITLGLIALGLGLTGWIVGELSALIISIILATWLVIRLTSSTKTQVRFISSKINLDGEVFSFAAIMFGIGILTFTWQQVSLLITGMYLNAEQVGIYAAAIAIGAFIPSILISINSIFSPIIAELHSKGEQKQLKLLFHTITKWVIAFTWPFAVVVIVFAPLIMSIYGEEFKNGWIVLVIIAIGQLVNVGVGSGGILLMMSGHQRLELLSGVCAASISILLSIVLIPAWGIFGAALATAVGITIANLLRTFMINRVMDMIPYNRSTIKLLPAAAISGVVVLISQKWFLAASWPAWGILFIAFILSFLSFFFIIAVQGIEGSDRLILNSLLVHLRISKKPESK